MTLLLAPMDLSPVNTHMDAPGDVPPMGKARFTLQRPRPFVGSSQIKAFLRAPRAWAWSYVGGVVEKKSYPTIWGGALHGVLQRWVMEEPLYPASWFPAELRLQDVDLIRRLADAAIEKGIVARGQGRRLGFHTDVEARFCLEILPPEGALPGIDLRGSIDCPLFEGIDDFKSTASIEKWAKEGHELRSDLQLNIYAAVWLFVRRLAGMWDPPDGRIRLRHVYFQKGSKPTVETRDVFVSIADVEDRWERLKPIVRQMRDLALANLEPVVASDLGVGGRWYKVGCAINTTSADDVRRVLAGADDKGNKLACGDYGGCHFQGLCANVEGLDDYLNRSTAKPPGGFLPTTGGLFGGGQSSGGGSNVGIFDDMLEAAGGNSGATATAPPPATPASVSPAVAAIQPVPPVAPPTPPPGPKTRRIAAGAPPWAYADCTACVDKATDETTGLRPSGAPCMICDQRARADKRPHSHIYDHVFTDGVFTYQVKSEHEKLVAANLQAGTFKIGAPPPPVATPQMPNTVVGPVGILPASAPAPVVNAGNGAPVMGQNLAPAVPVTETATTPATVTLEGEKKPTAHKFVLCVGCGPDGEKAIRLERIWLKYKDLLAVDAGKDYYSIATFDRWDKMSSCIPKMLEIEKFGTNWVIANPEKSSDFARFVEAVAAYAHTVIRPR